MMAQAHTEAARRPSMTTFTTGCAVMKSSKKEKPPPVAGFNISRGFMVLSVSRDRSVGGLGRTLAG
jgi:hypothetical protein